VMAHYEHVELRARLDDGVDRGVVGLSHHDYRVSTRISHHFGFEITAIHSFEVNDDRVIREFFAQRAHSVQALSEYERRPHFDPVHTGFDGDRGGCQRVSVRHQVQGNLHDWLGEVRTAQVGNFGNRHGFFFLSYMRSSATRG